MITWFLAFVIFPLFCTFSPLNEKRVNGPIAKKKRIVIAD